MKYMLITNDPSLAQHAERCGVGRIFIDLEYIGKKERQGHRDTLMSKHEISDISLVKGALHDAELLVRVNPLYDGTPDEIDAAIDAGADLLMLPMFESHDELQRFATLVNNRIPVIPLVETSAAIQDIDNIVRVNGLEEIYIGLNDLHLDMGLKFMFEPLVNGLIDEAAHIITSAGLPFGFGGIARVGEGIIPGEMVLGEHIRLGSSSVILSRTFHRKSDGIEEFQANLDLQSELQKLNTVEITLQQRSEIELLEDFQKLQVVVKRFLENNV